ncbi:type II secretion system major pseudopilin GspG [Engelhardtia mirabilis]|uniref:Type II secretion system core protein G n=1 Tax=Engelhardtia mirabilis TaxID=2528011 RepID=A0A518BJS9_9BACT|nr:Type II secretion system protein G precursor [Planctomycetes bacterium Pla133]QDV01520.1 Type II secretion system protein G precursor [Planctomycetes bacterium Pla86]
MKNRILRRSRREGFSLAELMVVIVIIGLLVGVVAPNAFKYLFKGQETRMRSDLVSIAGALDNYALSNGGVYPDSLDALVEEDETGETYLKSGGKIPTDPWKNEYQYDPPSGGQDFRVYSMGEDGQIGGEGKAADRDQNWAKGLSDDE